MTKEFVPFPKMPRLFRECTITEKIDGTNASVYITDDKQVFAGSRNRWITPEMDNFGFAKWVEENKEALLRLGSGTHFGEWWGSGIQRSYGFSNGERFFSLFNVHRWEGIQLPAGIRLVPILYRGEFTTDRVNAEKIVLQRDGSRAAPGFMKPEGVIVFHEAAGHAFKSTIEGDEKPKSQKR